MAACEHSFTETPTETVHAKQSEPRPGRARDRADRPVRLAAEDLALPRAGQPAVDHARAAGPGRAGVGRDERRPHADLAPGPQLAWPPAGPAPPAGCADRRQALHAHLFDRL